MSNGVDDYQCLVFRGNERPDLLARIESLRLRQWSRLLGRAQSTRRFGLDRFDEQSWHVVYLDNNTAIASGRIHFCSAEDAVPDQVSFRPFLGRMVFPSGFFNRLVVDRRYRNRGLGGLIDKARIQLALESSQNGLWVEAESQRVPHLQRLGFVVIGASMDDSVAGEWHILHKTL
jgi:predicted GNAT family N-acyltransferase